MLQHRSLKYQVNPYYHWVWSKYESISLQYI